MTTDPKSALCPRCKGSGEIEVVDGVGDEGWLRTVECPNCKGTGEPAPSAASGLADILEKDLADTDDHNQPWYFKKHEMEQIIAALRSHQAPVGEECKYTDAIVDAPRQLLAYAETPGRTLEGAREHLRQCGVKFEHCWPDWAYENGHLNKAMLAELVHRMMEAAPPSPQTGGGS